MSTTVDQLAGWNLPELRGGVGRLGSVAERLVPWRIRLDALGRRLGTADCWSGPAGSTAAAALVELSTAAAGISGALGASLTDLQGLTAAAAEAQEWAAAAVVVAHTAGISLDAGGHPVALPLPPTPAMAADQVADVLAARRAGQIAAAQAEEALAAELRAQACARTAQEPLARLGVAGRAAVGFSDLVVRLPSRPLSRVPGGGAPPVTAAWWRGLTASEQLAEIAARPATIGALDGLPAWARDRANRLRLGTALQDLPAGGGPRLVAETVARQLAAQAHAGHTAQLVQFDPAAELVAISLGNLDTAAAVGILVPGINTTPADDLPGLLHDAAAVGRAAAVASPGLAVATVAWLGYRTPDLLTSVAPDAARRGGPALDRTLDGFAAARSAAAPGPTPRTTVVAHSYGTVVAGQAVRAPGRLAADALVLLGSPGLPGGEAADLEAGEVYGAWSAGDPISWLQWFGDSPSDASFGDIPLPTDPTQSHTDYYDADRPTLAAIGEVVAGVRRAG